MSAFLKIDRCAVCRRELPWEWIPPIELAGRPLTGTGVWQSALVDGRCAGCLEALASQRQRDQRRHTLREQFIRLVGGVKPYRKFTFDQYQAAPGNRAALEQAKQFDPSKHNLYLWGPSGGGKTHLVVAILRHWFARGASAEKVTLFQLTRKLRMKAPDDEQSAIDRFVKVNVLALEDVGNGNETIYTRQVLREILDSRDYAERAGLLVTSHVSLEALGRRWNHRSIARRLAGMCQTAEIRAR